MIAYDLYNSLTMSGTWNCIGNGGSTTMPNWTCNYSGGSATCYPQSSPGDTFSCSLSAGSASCTGSAAYSGRTMSCTGAGNVKCYPSWTTIFYYTCNGTLHDIYCLPTGPAGGGYGHFFCDLGSGNNFVACTRAGNP
jgi:hypothetical protein